MSDRVEISFSNSNQRTEGNNTDRVNYSLLSNSGQVVETLGQSNAPTDKQLVKASATIDSKLGGLTKIMQPKAMLDGFEEALNSPALASEPDQVHPRIGIRAIPEFSVAAHPDYCSP